VRHASAIGCACALWIVAACRDNTSHILQGRLYIDARDCLGTPSSVDVVSGADPGTCPAACLVQNTGEGGRAVYVVTTCPPYSPDYDTAGRDPACPKALAAFSRDDTCIADGGSTNPPDAGADATDATTD
jgi:hypothetical protein